MPSRPVVRSPVRGVVRTPLKTGLLLPLAHLPLITNTSLLVGIGSETFTRTNPVATFLSMDTGLITLAGTDVARFEAGGLLIEGQSTNLLLHSEALDNAIWQKQLSASVTADQVVAPDGNITADLIDISGNNLSRVLQQILSEVLTEYNASSWLRSISGTGFYPIAGFNGNTRVGDTTLFLTETMVRFSIVFPMHSVQTDGGYYPGNRQAAGGGSPIFQAYAWGHQLEKIDFTTSYIPTGSSTVTRSTDSLDIDVANIPPPVQPYTVSMTCDFTAETETNQVLFNVEGETTRSIRWDTSVPDTLILATHGAVTSTSTSFFSMGQSVKVAFVVDATKQTLYINAVQEDQDTKGTVTGTATAVNIGHAANADQAYGHIKNFKTFDVALTQDQVNAL